MRSSARSWFPNSVPLSFQRARQVDLWPLAWFGRGRGVGRSVFAEAEHQNALHASTHPAPNTPEDPTKEDQRENRKQFIQRGIRRRKRSRALGLAYDRCRKFWKRDLEVERSGNVKQGRRLTNETAELSSRGGGRSNRNDTGSGVARDQKPVGGVEEPVVRRGVGVVRLVHRIGPVSDIPSASATPEGDRRRCQWSHRGKEMAPIGLPVVELHRAGARAEREVNLSFWCEYADPDDVGSREFRAGDGNDRWQGHAVDGVRNSNREFLTESVNGGPLTCSRCRGRNQCRQNSYRQHPTSTPEAKGRASWQ